MTRCVLCVLGLFLMNTPIKYGHAQAQMVNATLRADKTTIAEGGSVALTCSVDAANSSAWKYQWFTRTTDSPGKMLPTNGMQDSNKTISVTKGGIYWCRGAGGDLLTEDSNHITIDKTVSNRADVTPQPNWTLVFSGEAITLKCEIQGGGGSQWEYEWVTPTLNTSPRQKELKISQILPAHSGVYKCKGRLRGGSYSSTNWSGPFTLTVSKQKPKPRISANVTTIRAGGTATLTCAVTLSTGWKYYWYRNKKNSRLTRSDGDFLSSRQISVSQGGHYYCRGRRGNPVYYTDYSDSISLYKLLSNRAVVTLQPSWPKIYKEETVAFKCEIQDGQDTEWEYEWTTSSSFKPPKQRESLLIAYTSHNGDYKCLGQKKSDQMSVTEWSDAFSFRVFDNKPQPVLTASPLWLSAGASVNLSCDVEHPTAGWRFFWYKAVPKLSDSSYRYELLPGSSRGTAWDSHVVRGQTHTTGYVCRAGRGDHVFYTEYSDPKFVFSGDFHPSVSLKVSPDRVQHFTSESVSLHCEGNSADWRVRRFTEKTSSLDDPDCGATAEATCSIPSLQGGDTVYWCESESGELSNAVNITASKEDIILASPVRPVTEGHPVTLGCMLKTGGSVSNASFYHNDELIHNDTMGLLIITAVSKSDEGFYKCQSSGRESVQSWVEVKLSESSSLVPLIIGLLVGIAIIVLLLLLCYYKKANGLRCGRLIQSLSTDEAFATHQTVQQGAAQQHVYSSLLHGDGSIYESVKGSENQENDGAKDEYPKVTFQLKDLDESYYDELDESLYYNLNPELASGQ